MSKRWKISTALIGIVTILILTIIWIVNTSKSEKLQQTITLLEKPNTKLVPTTSESEVTAIYDGPIQILGQTVNQQLITTILPSTLKEISAVRPDLVTEHQLSTPSQNPTLATLASSSTTIRVVSILLLIAGFILGSKGIKTLCSKLEDKIFIGSPITIGAAMLLLVGSGLITASYPFWEIATREGITISIQNQTVYAATKSIFTIKQDRKETSFKLTTEVATLNLAAVQRAEKQNTNLSALLQKNTNLATATLPQP